MRVSQKEIARITGYGQSTVSMALAGSPEIAEDTRQYILDVALGLGYRPDPYLSGLAAYRKTKKPAAFQATLGFVTTYQTRNEWRKLVYVNNLFNGASRRAEQLGYRLEPFWLSEKGMTPARMRKILLERSVTGLMFAPLRRNRDRISMDLSSFAAITFGFTLVSPRLDAVGNYNYRTMVSLMRQLRKLGYRRPGLCLFHSSHARSDYTWLAGFWSEQQHLQEKNRIPWFMENPPRKEGFEKWLKAYSPDCVISMGLNLHDWLDELGYRCPDDIGLVYASVESPSSRISGMYENFESSGQKATDWLVTLLRRHEYGVPEVATRILIESSWVEGTTVRRIRG